MNTTTFIFRLGYPEETSQGCMRLCQDLSAEDVTFPVMENKDILGLYFNLKNNLQYKLVGKPGTIPKRHYNMVYLPAGSFEATLQKGLYSAFYIELTYPFLRMISERFPVLNEFLDNVSEKIPALLSECHLPITPDLFDSINEVIHNNYPATLKDDHYKVKFLDILITCLKHPNQLVNGMDMGDIVKIQQAHDLMMKNIKLQHTVSVLADTVGISKRRLENGFKIIFGTTVYDLLISERMKKAVALLRDTTMPLSEIAASIGYGNQNIFYNIFKRKFGQPPSTLRKNSDQQKK